MKKINWIKWTTMPLATVAAATPIITLGSCSTPTDKLTQKLYDVALNEFKALNRIHHVTKMKMGEHEVPTDWNLDEMVGHWQNLVKQAIGDAANFKKDAIGNIWYDIPASPGCDAWHKVMLQAHMDMMWAANDEAKDLDPWKDLPGELEEGYVDGHKAIYTKNHLTNNGADDAQGMALIAGLTILHDDYQHGPIRCVITTLEETGGEGLNELGKMPGGTTIDVCKGYNNILNLDGNRLGDVTFSTAGAIWGNFYLKAEKEASAIETIKSTDRIVEINITTRGGHSGIDMHLNLINSVREAVVFLNQLNHSRQKGDIKIISMSGTGNASAIPDTFKVQFAIGNSALDVKWCQSFWEQLWGGALIMHPNDKDAKATFEVITGETTKYGNQCLNTEISKEVLDIVTEAVMKTNCGILRMFDSQTVLTSINNVASVNLDAEAGKKVIINSLARSAWKDDLDINMKGNSAPGEHDYFDIENTVYEDIERKYATNFVRDSGDKGKAIRPWYQPETELKDWYKECCRKAGFTPYDVLVHAGAECSVFQDLNDKAQIICIGSTLLDEHNVTETLYLDHYFQYLKSMIYFIQDVSQLIR